MRLAASCGATFGRARPAATRLARWAVGRQISPNTLSWIGLLLAVCAAIWLSAGPADRAAGLLALSGSALATLGAGRLAVFMAQGAGRAGSGKKGRARADSSTDWLALPDVSWQAESGMPTAANDGDDDLVVLPQEAASQADRPAPTATRSVPAARVPESVADGRRYSWMRAVCAVAAESAIYGGMAAGGSHGSPGGLWPLAVLTVVSVGTADLVAACRAAVKGAGRATGSGDPRGPSWAAGLPALPPSARVVLAGLVLAIAGPRVALLAVTGANALALAWVVVTLGRIAQARHVVPGEGGRSRRGRPGSARRGGAGLLAGMSGKAGPGPDDDTAGGQTQVTAVVGVAGPAGPTSVRIVTSARAKTAHSRAGEAAATEQSGSAEESEGDQPIPIGGVAGWGSGSYAQPARPPGSADRPDDGSGEQEEADGDAGLERPASSENAGLPWVLALRDDGPAALWAGRLVQGNLIPLPPALAGLIATTMLAALGLRDLRGFIAVTPPIVMMLAAPGSSHPHDGRFDWLVPSLLALAQFVYLGALGFAVRIPGPVIFAACAMTALWYTSLAARGKARRPAAGIGWEGRLFLTGLAVTFGLGTFGYLGLAAYLAVLLVRQAATAYAPATHTPVTEGNRQ